MPNFDPNYDDSWATSSINASAVTDTSKATTAEISNDGKQGTEIAVLVVYGATVVVGAKVFILRDCGGVYEAQADNPYGFEMPRSASGTRRRVFKVSAAMVSKFKVEVQNDTGATITVTVFTKQAVTDQLN